MPTPKVNSWLGWRIFTVNRLLHATCLERPCWVSSDTGHCWFEASSRLACLQGLPEVGPARLLAAMLEDLGVSTLHSIKTMTQFSSLFGALNQPCFLLQYSGTTLRVHLRRPLVFLIVLTCWETCFSSRRYLTYSFFFFGPSYRPFCPPRCSDTTHECIFDALWFFFIVISIYWKSASYRPSLDLSLFGKDTHRPAAKLICSFSFLDRRACYSTCR
jgi:hypothetical protein